MGTWGYGPFDDDSAADWCRDLHEADPAVRPAMVEAALRAVAEETDYLDSVFAARALPAAAIVASRLPGGPPLTSTYAPDFLLDGGSLALPDHLPALALRALDRIAAGESEWRALWEDSGALDKALAELAPIRATLAGQERG